MYGGAISGHYRVWGAGSVTLGNMRKPYLAQSPSVANFCFGDLDLLWM